MLSKLVIATLISLVVASPACAQNPAKVSGMSLEDLLNIQVTSVSKTQQKFSQTPAAIYVITQEQIQHSGALNIPDLLRMVPGMDIGQINANTWAISTRGFNGRYADGLLVLLDGRSIYLPSFGGVYWDVLDLPLEDIDRIEVIRGPGGSIWGANAFNGVINIITKSAADSKGMMFVAGGGNLDQGFGTVQYGGSAGKSTDYRVYSKYLAESQLPGLTAADGGDGWNVLRGGFRVDSTISGRDKLTFQGNLYAGREDQAGKVLPSLDSPLQLVGLGMNLSGGFFQAVWQHEFSSRSEASLEISYDRFQRGNIVEEGSGVLNLDLQHHYRWRPRHNLVWGISAYDSAVTTNGGLAVFFTPPNITLRQFGAFAQDEIAVSPNRLYLTIGTRLEHEYYNGFGFMPTLRASWKASQDDTLWAAVSRALSVPDLNDAAMRLNFGSIGGPNGTLLVPALVASPELLNKELIAYEIGYRSTPSPKLSLDVTAYYTQRSHEFTTEPQAPFIETEPSPTHIVLPVAHQNLMHGETHGVEGFANWKVWDRLMLSPGYAFGRIHMHLDPISRDLTSVSEAEGSTPVNSAQLRSHFSLGRGLAWDSSAYFVGRIADPVVPAYTRLDTGLTWQAGEGLSFSIFGENLLKSERLEFGDTLGSTASTLVPRGAYVKIRWVL